MLSCCKSTCHLRVCKLTCEAWIATRARKHGIHDNDMIHAFNHPILVDDLDDGLMMFVGADTAGKLLEVGVIDSSDGPIVIHAMPARPKYLR